ncbi:hypothetical protein JXO52_13985 [bacterium]|nr:hypothetical protein [bacterium]
MFAIPVIVPVIMAVLVLFVPRLLVSRIALLSSAALILLYSAGVWCNWLPADAPQWLDGYFKLDAVGLLFLLIMSVVFAASAVYSLSYVKEHNLSARRQSFYTAAMLLFVAAMSGVILSNHLALLWVFVEATTLSSAVLINFEKNKSALEAAWKYVFICSVGIALAFVGIIILSMGSRAVGTLFFDDLYAGAALINPFWLKMAFAFILVGFGTKIGVAPIHAWLPDAHSEAPSPVSALLSGTLLNTALLGLIRVQKILLQAGLDDYSNNLILIVGFLSMFISAVFMMNIKNYKRMLAYSSIENMGILFIGLTMGSGGLFAAMLHTAAHSFTKAALFLTSGNIFTLYNSKRISDVHGLLRREPLTGWLWIFSALAIIGLPPFPIFISKFLLIKAFFENGSGWLSLPFFLIIVFVMFGMMRAVFTIAFNESGGGVSAAGRRLDVPAYLPQLCLLALLLGIGVSIPEHVRLLLQQAAGFLP